MARKDGGNAFPTITASPHDFPSGADLTGSMGMSLRDYFAGRAMSGWLASYGPDTTHPAVDDDGEGQKRAGQLARLSYALADAMLAERNRLSEASETRAATTEESI